jgi:hypothetical protein
MKLWSICTLENLGIVTCDNGVETKCHGSLKDSLELNAFVAAQARVRCAAGRILRNKVFDNFFLKLRSSF